MTTIDTTEDIIRILREQPEVREEIRRLILADELLRLPAQFTEMREEQAEMRQEIQHISQTQTEMQQTQTEMQSDVGMLKNDVGVLKDDVGMLKGLSAFAPTERRYGLIALELGLEPEDLLTPVEIARLSMNDAARDIDQSAIQSFRDSDLVVSARASDGELCYIAVEISYTVDHSDIDRAIAHAELITLLTGAPAFPVVSGVRAAAVAETRLASDTIHWHKLPERHSTPAELQRQQPLPHSPVSRRSKSPLTPPPAISIFRRMIIGLLSDTHLPNLITDLGELGPEIAEFFGSVDLILHGGDLTTPTVLDWLEQFAPVLCSTGNNDPIPDSRCEDVQALEIEGWRVGMRHSLEGQFRPVPVLQRYFPSPWTSCYPATRTRNGWNTGTASRLSTVAR